MKPYILILSLMLVFTSVIHAASEYTITNKHRVIEEATLNQTDVPIGTQIPAVSFITLDGKTHTLDTHSPNEDPLSSYSSRRSVLLRNATRCV